MVFEANFKRIEMATYCMTRTVAMSWPWYKEHIGRGPTSMARFMRQITTPYAAMESEDAHAETAHFNMCDAAAIAGFLEPQFRTEQKETVCAIELAGNHSRGATLYDWAGHFFPQRKSNCNLVMAYDKKRFEQFWLDLLKIDH
jgi:purine nucleosidase